MELTPIKVKQAFPIIHAIFMLVTLELVVYDAVFSMDVRNGRSDNMADVTTQGRITVEKTNYRGWPNCYRMSNGVAELIVTTDVGPRIIRFGFINGENEFKEFDLQLGKTGGDQWLPYGGHRLWHAPEDPVRTYYPDNFPVQFEQHDGSVRFIQAPEKTTGIQKEIDVWMSPNDAHVRITHRLRNTNLWTVELAPWALSVMAPGGVGIFPLPPRGSHPKDLLPTSSMAVWAYTDMTDARWTWGTKYVLLRQDTQAKIPQKVGFMDTDGWEAYARNGHLFVKKFDYVNGARYPDFGCNAETFTNADMLEVETLGPVAPIEAGKAVEHVEHWFLFRDVPVPKNDADVDAYVLPKVREAEVR